MCNMTHAYVLLQPAAKHSMKKKIHTENKQQGYTMKYRAEFLAVCVCFCVYISVYVYISVCGLHNEVATISRLLKMIGLFCRISSLLQGFFAKETCNFKAPTNRSHPI